LEKLVTDSDEWEKDYKHELSEWGLEDWKNELNKN